MKYYGIKVLTISSPTETGKIFRPNIIDMIISKFNESKRLWPGEVDGSGNSVDLDRVSHFISKMWVEKKDEKMFFKIGVLLSKNKYGKFLEKYLGDAFFGIRYSGCFEEGSLVVSDKEFKFVTIDVYGFSPIIRDEAWKDFKAIK